MVSPVHVSRRSLIKALALAPFATPAIIGRAHAADPIRIGIAATYPSRYPVTMGKARSGWFTSIPMPLKIESRIVVTT